MRALAVGLAIAVIVFAISGGHFVFLPLLLIPLGLFSIGSRRRKNRDFLANPRGALIPVTRRSKQKRRTRV